MERVASVTPRLRFTSGEYIEIAYRKTVPNVVAEWLVAPLGIPEFLDADVSPTAAT
jgi:hypothetical protein